MNLLSTDHCKFCDYRLLNLSKGILCGLTDERPIFSNKCSKINLKDTYKSEIEDINTKLEVAKKIKKEARLHSTFYLVTSLLVIVVAFLVASFLIEKQLYKASLIVAIVTITILPLIKGAKKPNNKLSVLLKKKEVLDKVSKLYGYTYTVNIEHLKDPLGNKLYNTKINIKRTNSSQL